MAGPISTGGGNGDYILYGLDETQDWCERLLRREGVGQILGVEIINIQYHKEACYYYGPWQQGAANAGKSGPHTWTYDPSCSQVLSYTKDNCTNKRGHACVEEIPKQVRNITDGRCDTICHYNRVLGGRGSVTMVCEARDGSYGTGGRFNR